MKNEFNLQNYVIEQQHFAQGGYGKVYKAINKYNKQQVAIKKIQLSTDQQTNENARKQIKQLKKYSHQNIVEFIGSTQDQFYIYLCMEMCQCDLYNYISKKNKQQFSNKKLTQIQILYFMIPILKIFYSFNKNISKFNKQWIHRDLKPQNILIKNGIPKLSDFGLVKQINKENQTSTDIRGTQKYKAPQILFAKTQKSKYSTKYDIWSFGIILCQLIHFGNAQQTKLMYNNIEDYLTRIKSKVQIVNQQITQQLKSFLLKCLIANPTKRSTWQQLLKQPLVQNYLKIQKNIKNKIMKNVDQFCKKYFNNNNYIKQKIISIKKVSHTSRINDSNLITKNKFNITTRNRINLTKNIINSNKQILQKNENKKDKDINNDESFNYSDGQSQTSGNFFDDFGDQQSMRSQKFQYQNNEQNDNKNNQPFIQPVIKYNKLSDLVNNNFSIKQITQQLIQKLFKYENNIQYKQYLKRIQNRKCIMVKSSKNDVYIKVTNIFNDKSKQIIYKNGVKKQVFEDGYMIIYFKNGDIKQNLIDGTILYYFKEKQVQQITLTNGVNIYKYANNQVQIHFHNGQYFEVRHPDGTIKLFKKDKNGIYKEIQ